MKRILTRKLSIVGGLVGVLLVSSAIGAVANSSHRDAHLRIASASAPMPERSARLESPTPAGGVVEQQNAQAPEVKPEVQPNEVAENEPAENEAAENEAAENDNDEQPAPAPPSSAPTTSSRTFTLIGGTVMITCTGNAISLDSATPNAGFTIDSEKNDGGRVEVRFRNDSHESRLEVTCQSGTIVVQELREEQS